MEFSQILKKLRTEHQMSQQEVADRLGLNKQAISQYERGVRKPNFEIAEQLADVFHVDLNYLLEPARWYSNTEDHRPARLYHT